MVIRVIEPKIGPKDKSMHSETFKRRSETKRLKTLQNPFLDKKKAYLECLTLPSLHPGLLVEKFGRSDGL
jgi:hypothetical protein